MAVYKITWREYSILQKLTIRGTELESIVENAYIERPIDGIDSNENPFVFIIVKVRHMLVIAFQSQTALAAVSGDEFAAVAKLIDGQKTMVVTVRTAAHGRIVIELQNLIDGEHICRSCLFFPVSGDQSGSERAHDAGDIRTDGMTAGDPLESTEYRVIVKGTALHDNFVAQLFRICQFDNF